MKNLKKLIAIGVSMVMATSLFTGCSYQSKALSDALENNKKITSAEFKSDFGFRLSGENLSDEEKQTMDSITPTLNNLKISMNGKLNQSDNATKQKMQANLTIKADSISVDTGVWLDGNMSGDDMKIKEVVQIPSFLSKQLGDKQYIVLDTSKLESDSSLGADFTEVTKANKDFYVKLSDILSKNMSAIDASNLVTDKGTSSITLPDGSKTVHTYEVKIDDKHFKDLLKTSSTTLVNNPEFKSLMKDYIITLMKAAGSKENSQTVQAEIDKVVSDYDNNYSQVSDGLNKVFSAFDSVPIVGDNGIVIDYAVDTNGYIVNEKGSMDFVFDSAKVTSALESLTGKGLTNSLTGVYKLGFDFNADTYNINKEVSITLPELTDDNSIQYLDLLKGTLK